MGTPFGNALGTLLLLVAGGCGFISAQAAGVACAVAQYGMLGMVVLADVVGRPDEECGVDLPPALMDAYRKYHLFIRFPSGATLYSAALNSLRLGGFVFAAAMAYYGYYYTAAVLAVFFFLSGYIILKMSPFHYMGTAAAEGNGVAYEELKRIEQIQNRLYPE